MEPCVELHDEAIIGDSIDAMAIVREAMGTKKRQASGYVFV